MYDEKNKSLKSVKKRNIWMKNEETKIPRIGAYLPYVTARGICSCKERSDGIAHGYGLPSIASKIIRPKVFEKHDIEMYNAKSPL